MDLMHNTTALLAAKKKSEEEFFTHNLSFLILSSLRLLCFEADSVVRDFQTSHERSTHILHMAISIHSE